MNYEKEEQKRYEEMWKSLNDKPLNEFNYKSGVPSPVAIDFIKFLKKKKIKGSVLDLGCGHGRHSILFAKNGFDTYGIDFSKTAIDLARKRAKKEKTKINLKVGNILNLPYKNKFDIVIDFGCLHHHRKTQWKQYKKNLLKILKPNGYFLLYCFSANTKYIPKFSPRSKKRNWTLRKNHYNHFFTYKEVSEFFKEFELLKKYEFNGPKGKRQKKFLVFYMRRLCSIK